MTATPGAPGATRPQLSQTEFIAMVAMLFATTAFSIDAMLPAFASIADELTPQAPNRAQLIITSFVLGMGAGTLFTGPLSDAFGRKPVIVGGAAVYCVACVAAWRAQSLELVLAARVVQGIGASGPRIVTMAIIRDLYSGRKMARVMSLAMLVFTLVPAVGPLLGSWIIAFTGWRELFLAFVLFSLISTGWVVLRQPETLPAPARRPFSGSALLSGLIEVLGNRQVLLSIAVQTFAFAMLFINLSSTQQVFDITFGRGASFPLWFAGIALVSGTGSLLNAQIVERVGMRRVVTVTLLAQVLISASAAALSFGGLLGGSFGFVVYLVWNTSIFFMAGLTLGNLNALAMEPMGHIAGMAASIIGSVATVGAVFVAVPVGLLFDGTPVPLMAGVGVCAAVALGLISRLRDLQQT